MYIAHIITFDNLPFLLIWDNLDQILMLESLSSIPDISQYPHDSLWSGNHRKSLEVLTFNFHVKTHVKTSNKSTARGTNARHFLRICGLCCFQQEGATLDTTIRARSWL